MDGGNTVFADAAAIGSKMVTEFFKEKLVALVQPTVTTGKGPESLLQRRELEAHKTDNDEYYLLDDPKVRLHESRTVERISLFFNDARN